MTLRITSVKARYVHGAGAGVKQFHVINLSDIFVSYPGPTEDDLQWTNLRIRTACGQVLTATNARHFTHRTALLAVDPPKSLKPCPRCFARWEKLGKPLTAEQWAERIKALRVMTGHAARAKQKGKK